MQPTAWRKNRDYVLYYHNWSWTVVTGEVLFFTRSKPAYGRQGLVWDRQARIQVRQSPFPGRLGQLQVEALCIGTPWQLWAQPLTSMEKAELNQIRWITLFKDFCKNTSVFLQQYFSIFATSFYILAARSIKKNYVTNTGPLRKWSFFFSNTHFSLPTGGSKQTPTFRYSRGDPKTLCDEHGVF